MVRQQLRAELLKLCRPLSTGTGHVTIEPGNPTEDGIGCGAFGALESLRCGAPKTSSTTGTANDLEPIRSLLHGTQDSGVHERLTRMAPWTYSAGDLPRRARDPRQKKVALQPRPTRSKGSALALPIVVSSVVNFGPFCRPISKSYA